MAPESDIRLHTERLGTYAAELGRRVGLSAVDLQAVAYATLLHDLARLGSGESILLKPGPLTDEEAAVMRRHTEVGGEILSNIAFLKAASDVPMSHHEAWDGSGYPRGLKGEEIPLQARIFAVVDSYDAIRSERPYKCAQSHATAVALLQKAAGKRLDPSLVETFIAEPEGSWNQLEYSLSRNLTFEGALQACRRVIPT